VKATLNAAISGESFQAAFARLAEEGLDAVRIAEHAVVTWRDLDASLSPIIGQRGVDALYQRSLYLLRDEHPWLASVYESGFRPGAAPVFKATFARQDRLIAATTSGALLQTFHGLLVTLVGQVLTERLLQPVARQEATP
jgi:hypothetical protein